jgi:hypothetical protein
MLWSQRTTNVWEQYLQLGKVKMIADLQCTGSQCTISLPAPHKAGMEYKLVTSQYTMSEEEETARFLEQATFGSTRNGIVDLIALGGSTPVSSMATWIQQQLDGEITTPSSHREFFRKHGNAQFERSSKYGQVTHPCQANTMYRKFALSYKHKDKLLEIATVLNHTKKVLFIDGLVLTVVDHFEVWIHRHGNGRFVVD